MSIMKKPCRVSFLILQLVSSFWGFEIGLQSRWLCVVVVIPWWHRITTNPRIHHSSPNQKWKKHPFFSSNQEFNTWGLWDQLSNWLMNLAGCQLLLDQVLWEGWYWLFLFSYFFFFSLSCCCYNSFLLFLCACRVWDSVGLRFMFMSNLGFWLLGAFKENTQNFNVSFYKSWGFIFCFPN